jgi:drug/metabolite transporter (DMT)-like permease
MKREYLMAACTIFCWGTLPAITKLTLIKISNMQVLFMSSLIAAGCLYCYLFASGKIKLFRAITHLDLLQLIALGVLGNFLYSVFYYKSLRMLPASDACIINYLWPIFATVCAAVILHEKMKAAEWLAILISFAGVIIITVKSGGMQTANAQGGAVGVAGALCYGLFNVLNKKKGLDQFFCTAIYFTVTAVCSVPVLLVTDDRTPMSGTAWAGILWLGMAIDALATLTWGLALQRSEIRVLSNTAYLTPVAAMFITCLLTGERIERYAVIGMIFVLGGSLFHSFAVSRR